MPDVSVILIVVLVLFVLYVLLNAVRIVPEYERRVILSLGKYAGTRGPGLVLIIPFIERAIGVDLRERFLDIPSQTAITQDNAPIGIDFLVYYRVMDPKLSILTIDNVVSATVNIATTTLRAVIGDISLDDVLSKREQINDTLRTKLDEVTVRWGMKITNVEIREIEPPKDVLNAMNQQLSAERNRRAAVTQAAGQREAAVAVAEGEKQAAILRAEGEKQSAILKAEGERQSQLLRAQGFAAGLQALYNEAKEIDPNTMTLQYLETLRAVGSSPSTKWILPMEITALMSQFGSTLRSSGLGSALLDGENGSGSNGNGNGASTPAALPPATSAPRTATGD